MNTLIITGSVHEVVYFALRAIAATILGAGVILRDGVSVRGINTAATIWCSAAVGLLAGDGRIPEAVIAAILIVTVNLPLRSAGPSSPRPSRPSRPGNDPPAPASAPTRRRPAGLILVRREEPG